MSLDVLVLPGRMTPGAGAEETPRVNVAKFGDGYSQRSRDGLNATDMTFTGQCPLLTPTKAEALLAFFRAHAATPFLWALPLEVTQRKWIATQWSRSYVNVSRRAVSFTFTEVFDL